VTSFQYPLFFLLLLLIPLYFVLRYIFRRTGVPITRIPDTGGRTWRIRTRILPELLGLAALALLTTALARPREGYTATHTITEGIAIELVIDRSSSMDRPVSGFGKSRFEVVKALFGEFVQGRPDDLLGIVTFSRFAETWCPLTLTRDIMPSYLRILDTVKIREEDGTAIGDGIMLASARLKKAEEDALAAETAGTDIYRIKSKVIILFTDGSNNTGDYTPEEAALQADSWGVRVYTVGFAGSWMEQVDPETLQMIADMTGGESFTAGSVKAVADIFSRIDTLEKSTVETEKFTRYRERFQPFLSAGMILAFLSFLLSLFVYRRIL
jgi:Ca-activated chloride channel family protein